jgi:hypothetical protein
MRDVNQLIEDLRSAAQALEALSNAPPQTVQERQNTASVVSEARSTLRQLTNIGAEPEDFDTETSLWRQARQVADGRRILANALSIAAQSLFTAADPIAVRRDLARAARGLVQHAALEQALLAGPAGNREVA